MLTPPLCHFELGQLVLPGRNAMMPEGVQQEADLSCAGDGVLICVVGPSGAGKDTLINAARAHFAHNPRIIFPQRIISRPVTPDEPHIHLPDAMFEQQRREGGFFLSWQAHGVSYGLPASIAGHLSAGHAVVVNLSRRLIGEARAAWPRTVVIHVTVDPAVLRKRLTARGRETPAEVESRIRRSAETSVPPEAWVMELDNSGDITVAARTFCVAVDVLSRTKGAKLVEAAVG